jgi:putative ABC transport system permease protein
MVELGFDNLRRTRLRTALTVLGVIIGIGALASMVSFGTGMQRNITEAFEANDLFTSLFVTPQDIEEIAGQGIEGVTDMLERPPAALSDSVLQEILALPGVELAFPEITFPVRIQVGDAETRPTLRALPAAMGAYRPFSDITYGDFFEDDSSRSAVVGWGTLRRMGIIVSDPGEDSGPAGREPLEEMTVVHPDSLLGSPLTVVTATLDPSTVGSVGLLMGRGRMPVRETATELRIAGIIRRSSAVQSDRLTGGVLVPMKTALEMPRLGFSSVYELLGRSSEDGYSALYVRVGDVAEMEPVRAAIEDKGLHVFSIADQLKEVRRVFLIVDSLLAAVGTIALVVAGLGIINTMVMSILERTREIGVMKAIGASETQIRAIFFVEAGTIGVAGALLGLVLGYAVTRVANVIVNARLLPAGESPVNLFYFPLWLILGAIGFSIGISLVAGLYPAARAAAVDPVHALRHD